MNLFIQKSPKELPKKEGHYFIAYKDYENVIMAESQWSKQSGWWHGAKDDMIYWLEPCDTNLAIEFVQWLRENDWQCSREKPDCFDKRAGNLIHGIIQETKTTKALFKQFIEKR